MTLPEPAVFTVSQVTGHLRGALESDPFLADLWVVGEVSNLRPSAAGHHYFTLKDNNASLNCVLFRGQRGADLLAHGKAVRVHGRMSFYEPRGSVDFMVDRALPEGEGALAQELERLKARLEQEGLFAESRKRSLPRFPRVIGVVTSPTGAAWQDIQNVIRRRYPLAALLLAPTLVQGGDAAPAIAASLARLDGNGPADVIIVARGGGSLEDLWPFNEEQVARAIFRSNAPVVSGVGHETDFTIADYVADRRAPTPSAAAELVVPDRAVLGQTIAALTERSHRATLRVLQTGRAEVGSLAGRLEAGLPDLNYRRRQVDDLADAIGGSRHNSLRLSRLEVTGLVSRLRALDPAATLRRGFAIVQRQADGQLVAETGHAAAGDALTITVSDGAIAATAGAPLAGPPPPLPSPAEPPPPAAGPPPGKDAAGVADQAGPAAAGVADAGTGMPSAAGPPPGKDAAGVADQTEPSAAGLVDAGTGLPSDPEPDPSTPPAPAAPPARRGRRQRPAEPPGMERLL